MFPNACPKAGLDIERRAGFESCLSLLRHEDSHCKVSKVNASRGRRVEDAVSSGKLKTVKYVDDDEDSAMREDIDDAAEATAYGQDDTSDGDPKHCLDVYISLTAVLDEHLPFKKKRRSHKNTSKSACSSKRKLYRGKGIGKLAKLLEMPVDIFCEVSALPISSTRCNDLFPDQRISRTSRSPSSGTIHQSFQ